MGGETQTSESESSHSRRIFFTRFKIVCFMSVAIPFIVVGFLGSLLIFFSIRSAVWLLAKIFRPDLHGLVTGFSAILATSPRKGEAWMNVVTMGTLRGHLDLEEYRRRFQTQILEYRDVPGHFVYERATETLANFLGYSFWTKDFAFDVHNHIRYYDYPGKFELRKGFSESDLQTVIARLLDKPWNPYRSPWEVLIHLYSVPSDVPGEENQEEKRTVLIFRANHVLGDAYGLFELTKRVTGGEFRLPKLNLGVPHLTVWDKCKLFARVPYDFAHSLLILMESKKLSQVGTRSREDMLISVSPEISVEVIKRIKKHFRVYYGTVVYSVVYGAIARAVQAAGMQVPKELCAGIVVPRPNHPGGLCLHASVVFTNFPLKCDSPVERLQKIQSSVESLNKSASALSAIIFGEVSGIFPTRLRALVVNSAMSLGVSLLTTIIPVTTHPDKYLGCDILDMGAATGAQSDYRMLVTTCGFNNIQRFHFTINRSVFSSPEVARNLGTYVEQELQALISATV